MPPSEQNPAPANQPISNVPEYLHLDPIDPQSLQPKKSYKKLLFILSVVVVVIAGAGAAGLMWFVGASERGFYAALDKQLQTEYVVKKIEAISASPKSELAVDAMTQFSEGAVPKSNLTYSLSRPDTKVGTPPKSFQIKGETVIADPRTFYGKLTESPVRETTAAVVNDKWYMVKADDVADTTLFDAINARVFMQTFAGGVPTGNYSQSDRAKIIEYIKTNNVYTQARTNTEDVNGKRATAYVVKTDAGKLNSLQIKINELAGITIPVKLGGKAAAVTSELTVWVEDATGRIIQTSQQADTDTKGSTYRVTFDYPQSKSITQPSGAVLRRPAKLE